MLRESPICERLAPVEPYRRSAVLPGSLPHTSAAMLLGRVESCRRVCDFLSYIRFLTHWLILRRDIDPAVLTRACGTLTFDFCCWSCWSRSHHPLGTNGTNSVFSHFVMLSNQRDLVESCVGCVGCYGQMALSPTQPTLFFTLAPYEPVLAGCGASAGFLGTGYAGSGSPKPPYMVGLICLSGIWGCQPLARVQGTEDLVPAYKGTRDQALWMRPALRF